jgi:hypothetical protein
MEWTDFHQLRLRESGELALLIRETASGGGESRLYN